ncbi:SE1561 family protein [Bacillus subtilis]
MGNAVNNKDQQIDYLKNRLDMFMNVIDSLDPEATDVEDIDRLISMLDDLEAKYERFKKDWEKNRAPAAVFLLA